MPGSEDGKYEEHVDEEQAEEPTEDKSSKKKGRKSKKAAKEEPLVDEEKPAEDKKKRGNSRGDDDDGLQAGGGGAADEEVLEASAHSKTLHALMLIMLSTTLICLLAIIPTRSLGTAQDFSCGAWEACYRDECFTELPCGAGNQAAAGVFGIISIIQSFVMFVLQAISFQKGPDGFAAFPKIQCLMSHLLWLFVLISWYAFFFSK
ncbi:hypothetical protein DIPPA_04536 [Diplonema papillatum]|nr:hypothetical protein DIPPA_04536 [Diplonema papillatum]